MKECISHHYACDCREAMFRELVEAFDDLLFECDGIFHTRPPSREVYNKAFKLLKNYKERT